MSIRVLKITINRSAGEAGHRKDTSIAYDVNNSTQDVHQLYTFSVDGEY
jgi:hypothetical protein